MHLDLFQRNCVSCPSEPPACTCSADESCIQIAQSCNACPTFVCQSNSSSTSGSGGISSGALAGAIVAVILVLIGALIVFFLYRRRLLARQSRDAAVEPKSDVPAPAEAVLNRPDPIEKSQPPPTTPLTPSTPTNTVRMYPSTGDSVIDLDPRSQSSLRSIRHTSRGPTATGNPFDDGQSIQTTSTTTNGTNVIPIALVSPGSVQPSSPRSDSASFPPSSPVRPARPTDLVLDAPQHSFEPSAEPSPNYERSQCSAFSRNSYASNASFSSDFLNEAPMIVTHTQGAVRQVVGKVRAEVIQTSGNVSPNSHLSSDTLKTPSVASRPSVRSPLASSSFGPGDIATETADDHELSARSDPFGDHHAASEQASAQSDSHESVPSVQPAFVVDEASPRSVKNGLLSARSDPKSSYGTSMAKLLPPSPIPSGTLQEQQQRALAHAQAQARAQNFDKSKRMSGTSVVSTTSTKADSILESFPFVPPSPISSRPVRSPPRSPLGQQFTAATQSQSPLAVAESVISHSVQPETGTGEAEAPLSPLDPPPSRRVLGMSTGSQLSTASSGLGNFPFQIDHGGTEGAQVPSGSQGRQRASLDTLALMSDLSSYPLGYDRDDHGKLPPLPKS